MVSAFEAAVERHQRKVYTFASYYLGNPAEAEDMARKAVDLDAKEAMFWLRLAGMLELQGKYEEAEPYYREALERGRHVLGPDDPDTLIWTNNMGYVLQQQNRLKEAETYFREALDGRRRVLGEDHRETITSINNVGYLLLEAGRGEEARPLLEEALAGASADDIDGVIDAVKRCWASLWLPAAREYRLRHRVSSRGLAMAVVLQSMVEADWSGVGFTIDPASDRPAMRVEMVPGLGEALVSGQVTPVDFSIQRDTLEITSSDLETQPLRVIEDLARMMLQVEMRFDEPQDIEWASVGSDLVLLQSRPVTVVGPRSLFDDGFDPAP